LWASIGRLVKYNSSLRDYIYCHETDNQNLHCTLSASSDKFKVSKLFWRFPFAWMWVQVETIWLEYLHDRTGKQEKNNEAFDFIYFVTNYIFSFLIIIIIKLILLKIRVRTVKFQIYEWQRATASDAFEPRHSQWRWVKHATVSDVFAYKTRRCSSICVCENL
jgi:hypothetical protein